MYGHALGRLVQRGGQAVKQVRITVQIGRAGLNFMVCPNRTSPIGTRSIRFGGELWWWPAGCDIPWWRLTVYRKAIEP